jgi:hypothetical protein
MATVVSPYPAPIELERRRSLRLLRYVTTTDHKEIGHLYLLATLVFFLLGGLEALLIRIQLAVPRNTFLEPGQYNAIFTTHGVTMIFFVIMPMLLGFANFVVPLQIGARDMAFPRLNAFSFWLLLFGGLLFYFGFLAGSPPDTGWFSYPPLALRPYTLQASSDYWALGLLVSGAGTIATGLNLVVTVVKMRAPGMSWFRLPVFTWMSLVTGLLILAAIPALTAAQIMVLFDRYLGTHFFDARAGGDPVLYQHLFWYFGHPEVYIMALPAWGIMSEVVPVFSRKPIFGYPVIVASGIAIAFLSAAVWAHHMFTVGLGELADASFGLTSMAIAVPTGIAALPPIESARPLWDLHHPRAAAEGFESGGTVVRAGVPRPAPPSLVDQWPSPIVGILAFIFSEATFFGCLIIAYIEYRYRSPSGPTPHDLDVPRTAIFSMCLFASSATIYLAERRLHRGDERGFRWWWLATIALGAAFLVGQLTEYIIQYREGIIISRQAWLFADPRLSQPNRAACRRSRLLAEEAKHGFQAGDHRVCRG